MDIRKLIKECITQVLREELEDPLYVEYHSQRSGENPFMLHGKKFEYVNAKYPNGKIDIGVYAFAGDIVYSYNAFRQMYNIREAFDPTSVGPNPEASEGLSDGNPYAAWNAKMRQMENLPVSGEEKYSKQQPGGEMAAVNATTIANETMGRYAQEAGADGFGTKDFSVNDEFNAKFPNLKNDMASATGNSDLDFYIKNSGLSRRNQLLLILNYKGYTGADLAQIFGISVSRSYQLIQFSTEKVRAAVKHNSLK